MTDLYLESIRLMELPEVEREEILSQRMEEMQRLQDKRNLDQMHRAQRGESDNVSKAAKRAVIRLSLGHYTHFIFQAYMPSEGPQRRSPGNWTN